MVFKRFEDIVAWQLADQLRKEVIAASARGSLAKDYKFCAQIRDAANSGSSNIAEGFKRFNPREFAQNPSEPFRTFLNLGKLSR